jgi:hypothetical protein
MYHLLIGTSFSLGSVHDFSLNTKQQIDKKDEKYALVVSIAIS